MRKIVYFVWLGVCFLASCDEKIAMQNQPFETKPVIYCLIDPNDTVHTIRIERMFSGLQPPAVTAAVPDSIYFRDIRVSASFTPVYSGTETSSILAQRVEIPDKEPGYFSTQEHSVYQFSKIMKSEGRNLYSWVGIRVEVPGLEPVTAMTRIINSPVIYSPHQAQKFIYIVPDRPLLIQWTGGSWNEVDIRFEIMEMYADSVVTKILQFQKINDVQINGKYYEIKIPYDLVVQTISKNFQYRRDIIRRYFGKVSFSIHTGQDEYAKYIEYQDGINDFNQNPFSNIENAFGLLSSKSTVKMGPMDLDQDSRFAFANDPVLKKLSFIEY